MNGILITGFGHGGTRLVVDMLSLHDKIYLPKKLLNSVNEYKELHRYYIDSYQNMPFDGNIIDYLDKYKFNEILSKYSGDNDNILIKMPFYPSVNIDYYIDFFDDLKVIFVNRDKGKILKSFTNRIEHKLYFDDKKSRINQLKKLDIVDRKNFINKSNEDLLEECFFNNVIRKKKNIIESKSKIIDIDIENFSFNSDEIIRVFNNIGFEVNSITIDKMMSVVNKKRLKQDGYNR